MTSMSPHGNFPSSASAPARAGVSLLVVIIIAAAFLGVGCVGGVFIGMALNVGQSITTAMQNLTPQNVVITTTAPTRVKSGEEFQIVVDVTDTSGSARTIGDIDFEQTLLDGASIVKVDPPPSVTATMTMIGYASHTMKLGVPASGAAKVTFTLKAGAPGTYAGDVDTYLDSDMAYHTDRVTIIVEP